MKHYCTNCGNVNAEIKAVKRTLEAWTNDSIKYSMIKFINKKGLSEEWAHFLLECIHAEKKDNPHE